MMYEGGVAFQGYLSSWLDSSLGNKQERDLSVQQRILNAGRHRQTSNLSRISVVRTVFPLGPAYFQAADVL